MIELSEVIFKWQPQDPPVINIPELIVDNGQRVFISGPSGSGKTTLLNLLGGVVLPESGSLKIMGQDITTISSQNRDTFRADNIGFIFQMFNLIPYLTILENVTLPCKFSSSRRDTATKNGTDLNAEAKRLLIRLGLDEELLTQRAVTLLSTGQQQRVAVARALLGSPPLIIADEPTSALDSDTRLAFIDLLFDEVAAVGSTLVFVSHDQSLSTRFDTTLSLPEVNIAGQHS